MRGELVIIVFTAFFLADRERLHVNYLWLILCILRQLVPVAQVHDADSALLECE